MDDAIDLLKPGVSSDRIAAALPTAEDIGFASEMDAFGLNFCHGWDSDCTSGRWCRASTRSRSRSS